MQHPHHWPGVHSSRALCDDEPMVGEYIDRTLLSRLLIKGEAEHEAKKHATSYFTLTLQKPRVWSELSKERYRSLCQSLVERAVEIYRKENVLGIKKVLCQDIYVMRRTKKGARPLCRALSEYAQHLTREYRRLYRAFVDSFSCASHELRTSIRSTCQSTIVRFPMGGVPLFGGSG